MFSGYCCDDYVRYGSWTVPSWTLITQPTCEFFLEDVLVSPRVKWFGDRLHWIDIGNMQLTTTIQMALIPDLLGTSRYV